MRSFLHIITVLIAMFSPLAAFAVTDQEMEQARTIATKAYLRYANDGSGYLDDINPTTMADLEKALKPKEKENIKAFKAIPVPADYKTWDKQRLIDYWAVTAFQTKGLIEKGKLGKTRTKNLIGKMTVTPPQAETPKTESAPAAAATALTEPAQGGAPESPAVEEAQKTEAELAAAEKSALDALDAEDADAMAPKEENHTWVYIMVLGILVAVVVVLVVMASNVMKKNERQRRREAAELDGSLEEMTDLKETLADKDTEIAMLTKKLEGANRQNSDLKIKLEALTAEIASLRSRLSPRESSEAAQRQDAPEAISQHRQQLRTIYLGRANAKGIFVRADRHLNLGNSFFRLDTSDGFSGTFHIADNTDVWTIALENPKEYLMGACVGTDLENTEGASRIITESPGAAIFEGGCWRVIRKSKIRYV